MKAACKHVDEIDSWCYKVCSEIVKNAISYHILKTFANSDQKLARF